MSSEEARLLLTLAGPVSFLSIQGGQSKKMGSGDLQILQLSESSILLHCESVFSYALSKPIPCVRASQNSFVFVGTDGECFGVLLPGSQERSFLQADLDVFLALLSEYSEFVSKVTVVTSADHSEEPSMISEEGAEGSQPTSSSSASTSTSSAPTIGVSADDPPPSSKAARYGMKAAGLVQKGTAMTTTGIAKGTAMTTKGIRKAKVIAKQKIKKRGVGPSDGSTVFDEDGVYVQFDGKQEVQVSEKTRSRILKAKTATEKGVQISGAVVSGATALIMELTQQAASKASDTSVGRKIASRAESSETATAAKEVAKASLLGILSIRAALDDAIMIILEETVDTGAEIARHAYGDQVGAAADDSADVVKGSAEIVMSVGDLGAKKLAKGALLKSSAEATMDSEDRVRIQAKRKAEVSAIKSKASMAKALVSSKVLSAKKKTTSDTADTSASLTVTEEP